MIRARGASAVLTLVLVGTSVLMAAAPAQAASKYRFWSYWYASPSASAWTYGPVGPAGHRVDDGAVEGWRFVVAVPNPSAPPPRTSAGDAFVRICGGTARPEGKDRVALVVDFGTSSDAPPGEHPPSSTVRGTCVVVPDRSSGLAVLGEAGYALRTDRSGLVCSLQGYPRSECGVTVKDSPTASPRPTKPAGPTPSRSAGRGPASKSPEVVKPAEPSGTRPPEASSAPASSAPAGSATASGSAQAGTPGADPSSTEVALDVGPPPQDPGGPAGSPIALLAGIVAVVAVSGAAFWRGRRRVA